VPAGELGELFRWQRSAIEIAEETLDFPGAKAQILAPDLEQRSRNAQPREIETGKRPRPDQERDAGRSVIDQPFERALGRAVLQCVKVIDDQDGVPSFPRLQGARRRLD